VAPATAVTALLPLKQYHPGFLRQAIESIMHQTSPHWRLVIVVEPEDVARFEGVLAEWLADPRVRIVPNYRRGYVGAFNTGMEAADTDFIAILLGDDMWDPRAVEVLLASIGRLPGVDLFHSGRRVIDGDGNTLGDRMPRESFTLEEFVWASQVKHLICWRRSMGLGVGGMDESLKTAGPDDYDFVWTLVERGATVHPIPELLYVYRDHREGHRHTTHIPRSQHLRDLRHILTKHGVAPGTIRRRLNEAKRGYLRQCLYRNYFHRDLCRWFGVEQGEVWRLDYRRRPV
jgi:glycosyltransferase involved in cell wall biosynthesis